MEDGNGFLVQCLDCGSTDVSLWEDTDYDMFDETIILGTYLRCEECHNMKEI